MRCIKFLGQMLRLRFTPLSMTNAAGAALGHELGPNGAATLRNRVHPSASSGRRLRLQFCALLCLFAAKNRLPSVFVMPLPAVEQGLKLQRGFEHAPRAGGG